MSLDPTERFALFAQAGKRLRAAIQEERWKDVAEEARFAKALLTQIESAAEARSTKREVAA